MSMSAAPIKQVKQLFDSEYIKPEDNKRVIQHSNPVMQAVFNDALSRYQEKK